MVTFVTNFIPNLGKKNAKLSGEVLLFRASLRHHRSHPFCMVKTRWHVASSELTSETLSQVSSTPSSLSWFSSWCITSRETSLNPTLCRMAAALNRCELSQNVGRSVPSSPDHCRGSPARILQHLIQEPSGFGAAFGGLQAKLSVFVDSCSPPLRCYSFSSHHLRFPFVAGGAR